MKFLLSSLLSVLLTLPLMVSAEEKAFNYEQFTHDYFAAWTNVQKPNASKQDLEHYLSYLTDDIGYQHLPYANDDSRAADGKALMRKGMSYYLGIHTEYQAQLTNSAYGNNVIMIKFNTHSISDSIFVFMKRPSETSLREAQFRQIC